jgi:hypothetical protein
MKRVPDGDQVERVLRRGQVLCGRGLEMDAVDTSRRGLLPGDTAPPVAL